MFCHKHLVDDAVRAPLTGTHPPVYTNDVMTSSTTPSRIRPSGAFDTPSSVAGSALGVRSLLGVYNGRFIK